MTAETTAGQAEIIGPGPVDPRALSTAVAMRDGVRLATDVYLPEGGGERLPTVLIRLPYDKSGRYTFMPSIAGYLNAHGFAAVIQDVRGKFRSEGDPVPFVNEAADGYDTLEWLTRQGWCSGQVGMLGDSYYGFTQWAAASTGHPALKAIVPRVTGSRFVDMVSSAAVPKIPLYEWVLHTFSIPGLFVDSVLSDTPLDGYAGLIPEVEATVPQLEAMTAAVDDGSQSRRMFPNGDPAPGLTIPALHMGGWWDNLGRCQFDDWRTVQSAPAAAHQFLRVAPTDHEDFELHEADEPHRNHETDDAALIAYLPRMLDEPISFLGHYLNGATERWRAPRIRYQVAYGATQVADRWPPAETHAVVLWLEDAQRSLTDADGGALVAMAPQRDASGVWEHDPTAPVPYLVENEWGQLADLPDESELHRRPDVATFTSSPQTGFGQLEGSCELELTIGAQAPTTHVIARLLDVLPSGAARLIVEGATLARMQDGRAQVSVRLGETAYRLREGHRLRLAISSSCFPLYFVHPGTDDDPRRPTTSARVSHKIHTGPATPARLRLDVRGSVISAPPARS